ncbi:MAG: UDP-glucose/GDP-mannose dehydrogenase family protein [Candidatus Nanoarchaeia archaeon]|nr:UDP-glucose/GDP-mannose dehydrogenase family protein [Candidatus Nanoarchaeia archaeon]
MNIAVFGSGYVGLVTGNCFAKLGNKIAFVDVDENKINMIREGVCPIYETGLPDLMADNHENKRISATLDYVSAVKNSEIIYICVGTPSNEDGSIDLKYIYSASRNIGQAIKEKNDYCVVVVKSTVVPGTTDEVGKIIAETSGKNLGKDFGLCMNPEFLREGSAIKDFINPDTVVLGCVDDRTFEKMSELYNQFNDKIYKTNTRTAEMIKYAKNSFLATKISFINEIANISEKLGVDVGAVAEVIGRDPRISPSFLLAGAGFGGSCFPKDVKALIAKAKENNYTPVVLDSVIKLNEKQPLRLLELAEEFEYKKAGILGIAFKPNTDDIREAPALKLIDALIKNEKEIFAYDPKAMENAKQIFPNINYCSNMDEVVKNSDIIFVLTDWDEFKKLENYTIEKPIIFGRKMFNPRPNMKLIGYGVKK